MTAERTSDPAAEFAVRQRHEAHVLRLPVILVSVALLSSILVPLTLRHLEDSMQRELDTIIFPTQDLVAARRSATERGIAANAAFLATGNPVLLQHAEVSRQRNDEIRRQLPPLIAQLRPDTKALYARLQYFEAQMAALRPRPNSTREELSRVIPLLEERQDSVSGTLDRLDEALHGEASARRASLNRYGDWAAILTAILSALSLWAIMAVSRLTRRERQARATAGAAVSARDVVVSVVSHDLRNPLSTIGMATSLLLDDLPLGDARKGTRKYLGMIKRASETMDRIIQDLLDIARIESGRLAVELQPVPAGVLLEEAADMLRPIAEKNGQNLTCEVPEGLPTVRADRDRVMQIFSNLAGNAAKFTPSGGTITLAGELDGSGVVFRVSDTGSGIPAENIPHLFDRFWQASRTDRRGIGLGLPIVKGLVEAHGGDIRVDSAVGVGTTFSFTVPGA